MKVSVIIPVYNGELYLRQCLDSVCHQTLREIEIICVDDGSTDSSYEILEEYQRQDSRIQLYRQQNLYAGAARNLGKKHASGEYLVFWDCDDYFELDALEVLYQQASSQGADICVCGASQYFQDRQKLAYHVKHYLNRNRIPDGEVFNRKENEGYILNFTNEAAWNKMFRRAFIEEIKLDFQPVRNGNDVYFTVNALCMASRITTVDRALINYRKNQKQSLVGTISKSPLTPFQAWVAAAENLQKEHMFPEQSFVNKVVGSIVYLLRNLRQREAFFTAVAYLKNEGLEKLHVRVREESFYYTKWHSEFVKHLIKDSAEDFQCYFFFETYIQLTERSMEKQLLSIKEREKGEIIKEQKSRIQELKRSMKELKSNLKEQKGEIKEQRTRIRLLEKENDANKRTIGNLEKECQSHKKELEKLKDSWSFKTGKTIMWLPGKIKRLFK